MTRRIAIVRKPCAGFADGITTAELGVPDLELALQQHARYCEALERCGCAIVELERDPRFPDSTFVEDTAVLLPEVAVITRPGAPSRAGEVHDVRVALERIFDRIATIEAPGTLDGGDVCDAGERWFIGISDRTNVEGARQLARILEDEGFVPIRVDVRGIPSLLHLKSGLSHLGGGRLLAIDALARHPALREGDVDLVPAGEEYASNCVRIGDSVLVPSGHPGVEALVHRAGLATIALDMSEFRKMDGGLSCLSLRF